MALGEASPRNRKVTAIGCKFPITLSGTVIAGDLIGYSSGWKRALATVGTAIQSRLVALQGGESGDVIEVAVSAVVGGFSGATVGGEVYNEEGSGVGGGYTETAPNTTNDVDTILGYILSASEVGLLLGARADSLSA